MRKLFALTLLILGAFVLLGAQGITLGKGATYGKGMTISPGSSGGGSTVAFLGPAGTPVRQAGASFSSAFSVPTGGTNVVAFAAVAWDTAAALSITSITYGGNAMTSCGAAVNSSTVYVQLFYLINPPTGSNTLAISATAGTNEIYANLVAFQGVNQTTPVRPGTYTTASGGSGYSITISSNANDLTMAAISSSGAITSTNQTSDGIITTGTNGLGSDHATVASVSVTDTWTATGTFALAGFSIQHA